MLQLQNLMQTMIICLPIDIRARVDISILGRHLLGKQPWDLRPSRCAI